VGFPGGLGSLGPGCASSTCGVPAHIDALKYALDEAPCTEIIFLWEMWEALRWEKCGRSRIKKKLRISDPEKSLLLKTERKREREKERKVHITSKFPV
jgi:hypothetical protein